MTRKKNAYKLLVFFQSGALYATITHDPWSEYNQKKSEDSKHQWSWGVWGCSENPAGFLGSK